MKSYVRSFGVRVSHVRDQPETACPLVSANLDDCTYLTRKAI